MQLTKVTAAAKVAPNYRVRVGALEVIGYPGSPKWGFEYLIRRDGRVAYGRRNADAYLQDIPSDTPIEPVTMTETVPPTGRRTDAKNASVGGYFTGRVVKTEAGEHEAMAIGYMEYGVRLFSVVPYLNGHRIPSLAECADILAGVSIVGRANSMEWLSRFTPTPLETIRRDHLIAANRSRAKLLRAKFTTDIRIVGHERAHHVCSMRAHFVLMLRGAADRHWSIDRLESERDRVVLLASDEVNEYARHGEITNARDAFRACYSILRGKESPFRYARRRADPYKG